MELKIIRMNKVTTMGKVLAFVDVNFYGLEIKGLKIVAGDSGNFVAYPTVKGKEDKFYSVVYPNDIILKAEIEKYILTCYQDLK